jgi:hypothetical protein
MNTANSFKQIQEEDELMFPPPPELEESILGSLQILSIMGQAMELYIPKVFEMFILTLGGTIKEIDQVVKDELPDGAPGNDPDGSAPGMAGSLPTEDLIV